MKEEILKRLKEFKSDLLNLKKQLSAISGKTVNKIAVRNLADAIATKWVEQLRSPLEHKFKLAQEVIQSAADHMKRLHILSRPSNLKDSYLNTINAVLYKFDNKFVLPIKQSSFEVSAIIDLQKIVPGIGDPTESDYLQEAINCATSGFRRAAVVMGWCAAIDKIQKKILALGLDIFNSTSKKIKNKTTGKFKHWNKEYSLSTLSELQTVFDTDLLMVVEGMGLIDGNQAERLRTCFQYRNHSAHPGSAPIEDPHLVAFFSDISSIVLQNSKFNP